MVEWKLANVIVADGEHSIVSPGLYVRRTDVFADLEGEHAAVPVARYDFATYMNALPLVSWRRYACLGEVSLRLRARGAFHVVYVGYEYSAGHPLRRVLGEADHAADGPDELEFTYPDTDCALLAFEVLAKKKFTFEEAAYYTRVDPEVIRPVELAMVTTTYHREECVKRTMARLASEVLGGSEQASGHVRIHVVDNGRTLSDDDFPYPGISVHPNPNVGGAGGFARGMIESLDQTPPATHVVLMDDDIDLPTETVLRTFNLLSLLRGEYAGSLLAGALLSKDEPDRFFEDVGYVGRDGYYGPAKRKGSVAELPYVMSLACTEPRHTYEYAGWWYCCIPTERIRRVGLPLPLFIRCDDSEYGVRCGGPIMSLNGICLWHQAFGVNYRASYERYQSPRNSLICQATTGFCPDVDFLGALRRDFDRDLASFDYGAAELCVLALEDYLRGPRWLMNADGAEVLAERSKLNEQPVPLETIAHPSMKGVEFDPDEIREEHPMGWRGRTWDRVAGNGRLLPEKMQSDVAAVVPLEGWLYNPRSLRNRRFVLAVSRDGRTGCLRTFDRIRDRGLRRRFAAATDRIGREGKQLSDEWSAAAGEMTSVEFWKAYLERARRREG